MCFLKFLCQTCSFFQDKTPAELKALFGEYSLLIRSYEAQEEIFSQGEPAGYLGIVIQGIVAAQKSFPTGRIVTLARFFPGQTFGESALFAKQRIYPATVIALDKTKILFLSRRDLLRLFSADQDILLRFMENISNRTLLMAEKIELLSLSNLRQRLAYYLIREAHRQNSNSLKLSYSRRELADYLNVPRPSLSREMGYLRDRGYIEFNRSTVNILQPESLKELLF